MVLTSLQQANALKALRLDRKRDLLDELGEINNELAIIDKWVKAQYDMKQGKLDLEVVG